MLIRILKSGTEKHVERDLGSTLIEAGLAEEIVRDGGAKLASPPDICQIIWRICRSTADERISVIRFHCAACRISGGAIGVEGAKQLVEKPLFHRGVKCVPPDEIVRAAHGHVYGMYKMQIVSQHQGYEGLHPNNWTYTDSDKDCAAHGNTTPPDRIPFNAPGSIKEV